MVNLDIMVEPENDSSDNSPQHATKIHIKTPTLNSHEQQSNDLNRNSNNNIDINNNNNNNNGEDSSTLYYPGIVFKKCLLPKYCHGFAFLLFLMCWAIVGQGMIVSGQLPITLPMLEKNFGYTSVQTGLIHSIYDASFGISAILIGFFGRKRKIMVIGIGIFVMAFGCLLFTLPNFLYNFGADLHTPTPSNNGGSIRHLVQSTDEYIDYGMCNVNKNITNYNNGKSKVEYLAIFCLAYSLIGIGAAPMHTLAVVYFDEHLDPQLNGMFLGIYYFFGTVGPALGFGLGSPFLSLPVTLKTNPNSILNPSSEGWIGAWWLGYIVGGGMLLIVGALFVLYPSRIPPEPTSSNQRKLSTAYPVLTKSKSKFTNIKIYFKSFKYLIKNVPYMFLICGMAIEGIVINGLGTFLAKIIEVQFRVNSGNASLLSGALVVIGAGLGAIVGGIIIKKLGNCPKKKALIIVVVSLLSAIFFSSFYFGCNDRNIKLIDLNERYEITGDKLACQQACNCHSNKYEPVCRPEIGVTYFSPCMAGCRSNYTKNNELVFSNCSCLESPTIEIIQGGCKKPCTLLWVYMPMGFLALFFNFVIFVPELSLMLQLLDDKTKNSGTGLQQISARVGFIIGPILYGFLLDVNCILWSKEPSDVISNCSEYNNPNMRLQLSSTSVGVKFLSSACYLITYIYTRKLQITSRKNSIANQNVQGENTPSVHSVHVKL